MEKYDYYPLGKYCADTCDTRMVLDYCKEIRNKINLNAQLSNCKSHCKAYKLFEWLENHSESKSLKSLLF